VKSKLSADITDMLLAWATTLTVSHNAVYSFAPTIRMSRRSRNARMAKVSPLCEYQSRGGTCCGYKRLHSLMCDGMLLHLLLCYMRGIAWSESLRLRRCSFRAWTASTTPPCLGSSPQRDAKE
jgi:hypothetical protein